MTRAERKAAADRLRELALLVENDLATVEIVAIGVLDAHVEALYGIDRTTERLAGSWLLSQGHTLTTDDIRAGVVAALKLPRDPRTP